MVEFMIIAFVVFVVCILIAAAISGIIMFVVRSSLQSVHAETTACNYIQSDSFRTTNEEDVFLYSHITQIPISQADNSNEDGEVDCDVDGVDVDCDLDFDFDFFD
ncbi:MAG: hypothetical protein FWC89_07555 [Defluviitaleaceae bacterium]|nr:hypothetical protein [Defluviitaleaceae bacterium]